MIRHNDMCIAKNHPRPLPLPPLQSLRERQLAQVGVVMQNKNGVRHILHEVEGWTRWNKPL